MSAKPFLVRVGLTVSLLAAAATMKPAHAGDKLLGTWGVTQVEGAGGGGLTPWATITGSGSRDQTAATGYATHWRSQGGFELTTAGAAVGLFDTVELSLSRWRFGPSDRVPETTLQMDVVGAKWRLLGDAVFDQDRWWPQIALGAQYKRDRDPDLPNAFGAKRTHDIDVYASATKVWLGAAFGRNLLANLTLRATRANQFGLLGFGGDRSDARRLQAEGSLALLARDDLAFGIERRDRPDNLSVFKEQSANDLFLAWFPSRHLSATLAWVDLGNVANKPGQHGWYLSLQVAL